MPHVDSVRRGGCQAACRRAEVTYLDPRAPVDDRLRLIRDARVVVTEAMHGAIVADALRTPRIAVVPSMSLHQPKWLDRAESLGVEIGVNALAASGAEEVHTRRTGRRAQGRWSGLALAGPHMAPAYALLRHRAEPQPSGDAAIEDATSRCEEALAAFASRRAERRVVG